MIGPVTSGAHSNLSGVEIRNPSRSSPRAARAIASPSWCPRRSGRRTQVPTGASVAAATSRPRSHRVVREKGTVATLGRAATFGRMAATVPVEAHRVATGHVSQTGATLVHVADARSMTASTHRLGSLRETSPSAAAWNPGASGAMPRTRLMTRRTLTSSGATGTPNAEAATARAVYGPIPGSASSAATVDGTLPPWLSTTVRAAARSARARRL